MKTSGDSAGPESVEGGSSGPATVQDHEWKFVVMPEDAASFFAAIHPFTAPEHFDPQQPFSWTRTTYLDTPELSYFRASSGSGVARKLRVRQYARAATLDAVPLLGPDCFLELKESGGNMRSKCRFAAAASLVDDLIASAGDVSIDLPPTGAFEILRRILRRDRPVPQVTSWYRRETRAGDGVRITLDSSIMFARAERPGRAGDVATPANPLSVFPFQVVEVKHSGVAPEWLFEAAQDLPEASTFSKFREGMACLGVRP